MNSISKYLPQALFALFAGKIFYSGQINLESCLALGILGGVSFLFQYFSNNKELKELEGKFQSLNDEISAKFVEQDRINKDTISAVASVKVGVGMTTRRAQ